MARNYDSTRWWENYLVRYFLPSVAGIIIISWLDVNTNSALAEYIPIGASKGKGFGTSQLLAWLLFGSLYCYIASYPCLVFHATRVLDFKNVTGNVTSWWRNPYVASILFAVGAYLSAWLYSSGWHHTSYYLAIISVSLFSLLQCLRLYEAYSTQKEYGFTELGAKTSLAYAYLRKLSKQRTAVDKKDSNKDDETLINKSDWQQDIATSYRHLREHGNTAFIFLLELALCPIFFVALSQHGRYADFYYLTVIVIIWILPSLFVHGFAQHLERRYSIFKH